MDRVACISVDLDEIPCYAAIHGIAPPDNDAATAIYRRAVPRLLRFFDDEGVRVTFFVIGGDVDAHNTGILREAMQAGHELANHTLSHRYDLSRQSFEDIVKEVQGGIDAVAAVGFEAKGFRAPGYTINDKMFDVLESLAVSYDSSVFPCPPYYAAKAAAIAGIALRGRRSHSVVDDPRVLQAPADPYHVGKPFWRRGDGILEFPIGVTRGPSARLPYIGTSLALGGMRMARWLSKRIAGRPLVNLELHGIDASDAKEDGLGFLARHQPDLRVSAAHKLDALRTSLETLRNAGYTFRTLEQASRLFA